MTLQEAIFKVLIDANTSLTSEEIAYIINRDKLYERKDHLPVALSQIHARARYDRDLIKINTDGKFEIVNRALHSFRITYYHLLNYLKGSRISNVEIRLIAATTIYLSWINQSVKLTQYNPGKDDLLQFFNEVIGKLENRNSFSAFLNVLSQLNPFELHEIYAVMHTPSSIGDIDTITFGSFYSEIINEYTSITDIKEGWFSTPVFISKFLNSFYHLDKGGKIFDPFSGYGGLLAEAFRQNVKYRPTIVGGDQNSSAIQLAELNLSANGYHNQYFYHKNAFSDWTNSVNASLIVSNPPLNAKIPIHGLHNKFVEQDRLLVDLGIAFSTPNTINSSIASLIIVLSHLERNGKAALIIPNGFLSSTRNDATNLKSYLLYQNWIEGVVCLPGNSFRPIHSVNCSIIMINKEPRESNSIFLCDASSESIESFDNLSTEIISSFRDKTPLPGLAQWVDINKVVQLENNIDPKRHLLELLSGPEYKPVRQVVKDLYSGTVVSKKDLNRQDGIPFLQVGDLPDSNGLTEIDSLKATYFIFNDSALSRKTKFIPDRSVLITKIGGKLKACLYRQQRDTLCNPQIIVIKVDEAVISPEYLITQLQSDYVLDQVDAIRKGAGMPHFSQEDFQYIKIKVPSLADQLIFVTSFYGKKLTESENVTEQKQEDDYYNIIANLKHELKQPVSSLGMDLSILEDFLNRKANQKTLICWDEPTIELLPGESSDAANSGRLRAVMDRILLAISSAASTLTKAEEILNIGKGSYHPEKINFKSFLTNSIKPVFSNENCTINILGNEQEIVADKYQMEILFKRLIENAIKHGFKKASDKNANIINITLAGKTARKEFNEIIVENNGSPFPDGFDINKLQKSGHTTNRRSGTGFGGFHIKRIIESHKGEIYIADKKEIGESQFKVKFKIYIP